MDNQETVSQNFELPPPAGGAGSERAQHPEAGSIAPEVSGAPGGGSGSATTATPAQSVAPQQQVTPPQPVTAASASVPMRAEDVDLIEKEWVEKAKLIVAQTTGDPYTQNKEINKMKADYIKKRYNKDIRLASE